MPNNLINHLWLKLKDNDELSKIKDRLKDFELDEPTFVEWMNNFKNEDEYKLALKIFSIIDYRSNESSIQNITNSHTVIKQSMHKLKKDNIILISSDDLIDSSNHFLYPLAKNWKIDTKNIYRKSDLTKEIKENKNHFFIFFNDTYGTGNQFIKEFKEIINEIKEENCAIVGLTITQIALDNFKKELPNIAFIYPSFASTKNITTHQNESKLTPQDMKLLEELGNNVYSKGALGYKNSGLLLAYLHQCPNNTLPIIWANGENNEIDGKKGYPWKPLFEYKKIKKQTPKKQTNSNYLTNLPPKNPDFVGREDELKQIKNNLQSLKLIYIVNGIGGVGKSELSYEYFHQAKDDYKKIAFIELDENTSLENAFIIAFKEKFQVNEFKDIIKRLQEYPKKNLFLIDNLENREDFAKIKSLNINFDLLITTRLKDIDTNHQLNLDTLNPKDAKSLFLGIYDEDEDIEDILIYLDNHPLFINLTAKSLKQEYITLEDLRKDIKNNTISKIDSKDSKTFKEHLNNRFNAQFQNEKNKELKILLQKLAIFPSMEIKFEVFEKLLNIGKNELQKLVNKGWLSKKNNQYKLHQIIRIFLLEEHKVKYEDIAYILITLSNYIDPNDSMIIASRLNHYIPVVESFLSLFDKNEDKYIAGLFDFLTYLYYSLAKYETALKVQNKSLNIKKKLYGESHQSIAVSYNLFGIIHSDLIELDKAKEMYKKSIKINKEVLGENHPNTATSYNNLALLYADQRNPKKAEEIYKKSFEIR
jgi:hypothetical protein